MAIKINKKTAKDSAPKSKAATGEIKSPLSKDGETVEVRKITNGFIARRSYSEGPPGKREYKTEEIYYENNPL